MPVAATVAVIGNGLNDIYPHRNQGLARDIIDAGGAIIKRVSARYKPVYPSHFLERNRLISALADVVVVIEAGERSGTLNHRFTRLGAGQGSHGSARQHHLAA